MRKGNFKTVCAALICSSFMFSSCIGSFSLHGKLVDWNQSIGDKFVNEVVYLALNIVPVYGISYLADALVLNSIEFWSGENPIASIGTVKTVKGENGNYLVTAQKEGYTIQKEGDDKMVELKYDKNENSWNVVADGQTHRLFKFNKKNEAEVTMPNGEKLNIKLNAQGVAQLKSRVMNDTYFAAR